MKTLLIIVAIFVAFMLLPRLFVRRRKKKTGRKRIDEALKLIEQAGLTAVDDRENIETEKKMDEAMRLLKDEGYKIVKK